MDRKSKEFSQPIWLAGIPFALAAVAIAVPWLMVRAPEFGFALQRGFALVCHQEAERSFVVFGGTVAVCARCLGIYFGAALGLLLRVPRRVAMRWSIVAVTISLVDWVAESAGFHRNWMFTRFALGIALGIAAAMLVAGSEVMRIRTQAKSAWAGTRQN